MKITEAHIGKENYGAIIHEQVKTPFFNMQKTKDDDHINCYKNKYPVMRYQFDLGCKDKIKMLGVQK